MSTTKPDTDTGWSKDEPKVDGVYWWRADKSDDEPEIISITANRTFYYEIAAEKPSRFEDFDGEWLGPVSPSDFEQLIRLRKAAEAALLHLQDCGYKTNQQVQEQLIAALDRAS